MIMWVYNNWTQTERMCEMEIELVNVTQTYSIEDDAYSGSVELFEINVGGSWVYDHEFIWNTEPQNADEVEHEIMARLRSS